MVIRVRKATRKLSALEATQQRSVRRIATIIALLLVLILVSIAARQIACMSQLAGKWGHEARLGAMKTPMVGTARSRIFTLVSVLPMYCLQPQYYAQSTHVPLSGDRSSIYHLSVDRLIGGGAMSTNIKPIKRPCFCHHCTSPSRMMWPSRPRPAGITSWHAASLTFAWPTLSLYE